MTVNKDLSRLPVLGLGTSLSLAEQPDPVTLAAADNGPAFIEYSGQLDVHRIIAEVDRVKEAGVPVLFHPSYINFCGSFPNSREWLDATALHIETVKSPWFAQDLAYCFWGEGYGYSSQFGYFMPPLFNESSVALAVERVKEVQEHVPVPVAIEPPPVTFVVGDVPLFKFIGDVAEQADCAILLDMGHLVSYEMASGKKVLDALQSLPCERVIELHIAGGRIRQAEQGPVYIDAHEAEILDETWQMFEQLLPLLPNVKAVCYECEGVDANRVLSTLADVRKRISRLSVSVELKNKVGHGGEQ